MLEKVCHQSQALRFKNPLHSVSFLYLSLSGACGGDITLSYWSCTMPACYYAPHHDDLGLPALNCKQSPNQIPSFVSALVIVSLHNNRKNMAGRFSTL